MKNPENKREGIFTGLLDSLFGLTVRNRDPFIVIFTMLTRH